jgi:hypothetical protein
MLLPNVVRVAFAIGWQAHALANQASAAQLASD